MPKPSRYSPCALRGFTMIELVMVMALVGLLLSITVPRYLDALERGKEKVLLHDLAQMRRAIDQYYGDKGAYPEDLQDLVEARYLRAIPVNPFTDRPDWLVVTPSNGARGRVYDVRDPANPEGRTPRTLGDGAAPPSEAASAGSGSSENPVTRNP